MREVVIDTETTGLNYKTGDRIIEIGCVELINHIPTGNNLQFYCSTKKTIDKEAAKVHGLTNNFLHNYPSFKKQSNEFLKFIGGDILIIHNADFDIGFINNELKLIGANPINNKIVDTLLLARKKLNTRVANLDYLCRKFSIDISARTTHGALLDCQLLAEVYIELIGGKQTALDFFELGKNTITTINKNPINTKNIIKITISEEEIKSHKEFVKSLKNTLWKKLDY